jgi:hydrogenase maturation protease
MSATPRILVAGVGNIFLGDDAFGVEVVRQLARRRRRDNVAIMDFGVRGLDLAYAILDENYEAVILVDAVQRGGAPGTLYVIEPDASVGNKDGDPIDSPEAVSRTLDTHNMDPARVLRLVKAMGGNVKRILMVGCEPSTSDDYDDLAAGLSERVRASISQAVSMVETIVEDLLAPDRSEATHARRFGTDRSMKSAAKKRRLGHVSVTIITSILSFVIGAVAGLVAAYHTESAWIGIAIGAGAMMLMGLIGAVICGHFDLTRRIDIERR